MQSNKPLFIPLNTKYFLAFKLGDKQNELRRYGKRWNEKTCYPGRKVTLSKGYGKHERLSGIVTHFRKLRGAEFAGQDQFAILDVFGTLQIDIACITIEIDKNE